MHFVPSYLINFFEIWKEECFCLIIFWSSIKNTCIPTVSLHEYQLPNLSNTYGILGKNCRLIQLTGYSTHQKNVTNNLRISVSDRRTFMCLLVPTYLHLKFILIILSVLKIQVIILANGSPSVSRFCIVTYVASNSGEFYFDIFLLNKCCFYFIF